MINWTILMYFFKYMALYSRLHTIVYKINWLNDSFNKPCLQPVSRPVYYFPFTNRKFFWRRFKYFKKIFESTAHFECQAKRDVVVVCEPHVWLMLGEGWGGRGAFMILVSSKSSKVKKLYWMWEGRGNFMSGDSCSATCNRS